MCHTCTSPTFGAINKSCLDGAMAIANKGVGPDTVIVLIWDGNGGGSQPVNGTNNGTVYPSHQAVADRTVILSRELSFSSCSEMGRSQDINYKNKFILLCILNLKKVIIRLMLKMKQMLKSQFYILFAFTCAPNCIGSLVRTSLDFRIV